MSQSHSTKRQEEDYRLVQQMQELFRDAVRAVMEQEVSGLEAVLRRLQKHISETERDRQTESRLSEAESASVRELLSGFHSEGQTLLHLAASRGCPRMLGRLLEHCYTPSLLSNSNSNDASVVTLPELLLLGEECLTVAETVSQSSSLSSQQQTKCLTDLGELKKLVNLKDNRGFTLLINATVSESEECMSMLLRLGADANARNEDGASAVHFAAGDGSISRLKLLAKYGSRFDTQSKSGTPLHWASGKGREEAIQFILSHGSNVDVNAISAEGLPPVLLAAVASSDLGVKYLVESGADIGMIVSGNLTVLHICAEHGLIQAVKAIILSETGLKCCRIETSEGNTPLQLAAMAGHREVIRALLPAAALSTDNSEDAQIELLLEEGKHRLKEWELMNQTKQEAQSTVSSVATDDSVARFDSICSPPKTSEIETQAEKEKEKANSLYKRGKFAEAIDCYSAAIALDKFNAVYWSNRSACYLSMKENQHALLDAEVCRRLKPDWTKGCYRLAAARLALGLYEDAAVAAFEGCKLDNTNEELKSIMQKAVRLGQEEHKKNLANQQK